MVHQHARPNVLIPSLGVTFLHLIIGHQSESFAYQITKLFLRCGGDPNFQSSDGVTPTHVAAAWGRNRILHLLLVNGGDPWLQDEEKKNSFNYAFEEKKWDTIKMLHYFQQMYSAANFKHSFCNLNNMVDCKKSLVYSKDHKFAVIQNRCTKSIKTQTLTEASVKSLSPVKDKIKYFEPKAAENSMPNDCYQTTCEVFVNCNSPKKTVDASEKKTFTSSICIEPTAKPLTNIITTIQPRKVSPYNMRQQLFFELQEAVRRRSTHKIIKENSKSKSEEENSDSVSIINDSLDEGNNCKSFTIDLENNQLLKNMSNFATQVMNDIELKKDDEKRLSDLLTTTSELNVHASGPELESSLLHVQTLVLPQNSSDTSHIFFTPCNSNLSSIVQQECTEEDLATSFFSIGEENKFTDKDIQLFEKNIQDTPNVRFVDHSKSVFINISNFYVSF